MTNRSIWTPMYYQGPYVPSGVLYGEGPSACHWVIPGYDPESIAINLYSGRAY